MRSIWIIARQEYLKFITRKGILFGLLLFPLIILLAFYVPTLSHRQPPPTEALTLVDRSGGGHYAAFAQALADDADDRTRAALAHYAQQYADRRKLAREIAACLDAPEQDSLARDDFRRLGGGA